MLPGFEFEVVNFDSKRFAEGKTLPQGGFISPEDLNKMGPQTNEVCLGVDDLKPFDAMEFAEALI